MNPSPNPKEQEAVAATMRALGYRRIEINPGLMLWRCQDLTFVRESQALAIHRYIESVKLEASISQSSRDYICLDQCDPLTDEQVEYFKREQAQLSQQLNNQEDTPVQDQPVNTETTREWISDLIDPRGIAKGTLSHENLMDYIMNYRAGLERKSPDSEVVTQATE